MSELDDLEEIADQCRLGMNNRTRSVTKKQRDAFKDARRRGAAANRSVEKQQQRSSERRKVLVIPENQS